MHNYFKTLTFLLVFLCQLGYGQDLGEESYGIASFYSNAFYNKKTANQELLNRKELTAAHRLLPFNTLVEVTNIYNKRSIIVRINDRGPYKSGRIIDLTEIGAKKLNIRKVGLSKVKLKIIGFENEQMLIPYQHLEMETTPKFSKKFYQKTRLKYKKKYRLKRKIKNKKYLKKGKKKSVRKKKNVRKKSSKRRK
ncbi:septal ring lytic transglycosylase RlpA family protein [Aquirufa sp. ROCK-SH2]